LEVGFGFFEGVAFGDGGGDLFHPAGVAALGCGFVNGGELHGERMGQHGVGFKPNFD
jgi:hypothetical protein